MSKKKNYSVEKTEKAWKAELSSQEYNILREKGTEYPFTGKFNDHYEKGTYTEISEDELKEYEEIDKTSDDEVTGVNWLDTVQHMLVFFGESRTESCSGIVVADHDQN